MIGRLNYQGPLGDRSGLAGAFEQAGLSRGEARSKAALAARAAHTLRLRGRLYGFRAFYVPGRLEVIGKHTDYAGGQTMTAAVERGFVIVSSPREDSQVKMTDVVRDETVRFNLDPALTPPAGRWENYPMTAARRIARNFAAARRGADIAFGSDLPLAAGMSSSSALVVATFLALADANDLLAQPDFTENIGDAFSLAAYLACVENGRSFGTLYGDRGVGTSGGSEDHTAMLCSRAGWLHEYSYAPIVLQRAMAVPAGYTFVIASSGVVAEKTGAAMEKYNAASRLAAAAAQLWRQETGRDDPHLAAALASGPDAAQRMGRLLETATLDPAVRDRPALLTRFRHFLLEDGELRPLAGDALARGDYRAFGELVDRSQRAAEELLGNQIAETSYLAASARRLGAAAAIYFGAGFGGSVWAMVETHLVDSFLADWSEAYGQQFPAAAAHASFFATSAGPAALRISP